MSFDAAATRAASEPFQLIQCQPARRRHGLRQLLRPSAPASFTPSHRREGGWVRGGSWGRGRPFTLRRLRRRSREEDEGKNTMFCKNSGEAVPVKDVFAGLMGGRKDADEGKNVGLFNSVAAAGRLRTSAIAASLDPGNARLKTKTRSAHLPIRMERPR